MSTSDAELLQQLINTYCGGLTQAQAANLLGITQPGINNVLTGRSNFSGSGRAFVQHLLGEQATRRAAQSRLADWAITLRRVAAEVDGTLPPEMLDNTYIMADVG